MDENVFDLLRAGGFAHTPEQFQEFREAANRGFVLRQKLNSSQDPEKVNLIMGEILGCPLKEDTLVVPPLHFDLGFNIHLGKHVIINYDCVLLDDADITIGDSVVIGPGCKLVTAVHPVSPEERKDNPHKATGKPITVEDNVWIGAGAIILPGIRIGRDSVVGAGAVVTHDVEPRSVVAGNPARVIRML